MRRETESEASYDGAMFVTGRLVDAEDGPVHGDGRVAAGSAAAGPAGLQATRMDAYGIVSHA